MKNLKNKFILASAILALASCADNSYLGENEGPAGGGGAISFDYNFQNATRSGDATQAGQLSNQFIVWGEKNETQTGAGTAPSDGNLVFPNYIVRYTASTANTTTSNTNDWEYVGITATDGENTNISPNAKSVSQATTTPAQTIKYWDNAATSYTFTAVSATPADISAGRVKITKNQTGTNNVYEKGYTITLAKNQENNSDVYPSLTYLYFADRINIEKGGGYSHNAVEFSFRNALSQIRAGVYETVPGYNVSSIKFYVNNTEQTPAQTVEAKASNVSAFGAVCDNSTAGDFEGTITVTYYSTGTDVNKPILTVAPGQSVQKSNLILGTNLSGINATTTLSETASTPSWDQATGAYTAVLPQATTNPLKLKCDYTLYNPTTKETINITGKTAEIPAQYLQWKANFKYSYIFKITDDDLNPITFDAITIDDGEGNQQTITTVDSPSITTYQNGTDVTTTNEYAAGDIYVVVGTGTPLEVGKNAKLYTAATGGSGNYTGGITEASVANALKNGTKDNDTNPTTWTATDASSNTLTITSANGLTPFDKIEATASPTGADLTINGAKFTAAAPVNPATVKYYVFEYTKYTYTQATGNYLSGTKYYTDNTGATEVNTSGFTATTDVSSYYVMSAPANPSEKHYKVIKVVD